MTEFIGALPVSNEGVQFRAHHFGSLLYIRNKDATTIADEAVTEFQHDRGDHTSETVDLISLSKPHKTSKTTEEAAVYDAKYAIDLIGDTEEQSEAYRGGIINAFNQWITLGDDAIVTLDTKPDAICGSCTFGYHCKRTNIDIDVKSIQTLGWVSEGLGLDNQVEINGKLEDDSLKLVTTAGVLRRMMQLFKDADPQRPQQAFGLTRDTLYQPFMEAVIRRGCEDYQLYELPKDHIDPGSFPPTAR